MTNDFFYDDSEALEENENENELIFAVTEDKRLDSAISDNCEISRSSAAKLIEGACVFVDGKEILSKSFKAQKGSEVLVKLPAVENCKAIAQNIPLDIIYEDSDIIVVNKAQGMVVHPAAGNYDGTLVNALLYHCGDSLSGINGVIRPGIVHRIDKDTSGLLMVAKNDNAHIKLAEQIKEHSFTRVYNALLIGIPKDEIGTVDAPIGRHPTHRKKMAVTEKNSKNAVTHYRIVESFYGNNNTGKYDSHFSFAELKLETGRTHQIRVHMAHIGYPIAGDPLYSPKEGENPFGFIGQCLHASRLGFIHPTTGRYLEFSAPLPDYFENALEKLRKRDIK